MTESGALCSACAINADISRGCGGSRDDIADLENEVTDMATPLQIDSRLEGEGSAVLALSGEIDVSNTAQVRDAGVKLLADGATRLVVDLSLADYMDSAGLGTLVGMLKRVKEAGGAMAIAGPQPRVRRLFEITGLDQIFSIYEDLDMAMKEVRA